VGKEYLRKEKRDKTTDGDERAINAKKRRIEFQNQRQKVFIKEQSVFIKLAA
jgi:hypothetical protein